MGGAGKTGMLTSDPFRLPRERAAQQDFPLAGKPTDVPEVAFTNPAPLEGGPFVTIAGGQSALAREPRVRVPGSDDPGPAEPKKETT